MTTSSLAGLGFKPNETFADGVDRRGLGESAAALGLAANVDAGTELDEKQLNRTFVFPEGFALESRPEASSDADSAASRNGLVGGGFGGGGVALRAKAERALDQEADTRFLMELATARAWGEQIVLSDAKGNPKHEELLVTYVTRGDPLFNVETLLDLAEKHAGSSSDLVQEIDVLRAELKERITGVMRKPVELSRLNESELKEVLLEQLATYEVKDRVYDRLNARRDVRLTPENEQHFEAVKSTVTALALMTPNVRDEAIDRGLTGIDTVLRAQIGHQHVEFGDAMREAADAFVTGTNEVPFPENFRQVLRRFGIKGTFVDTQPATKEDVAGLIFSVAGHRLGLY